MDYKKIVKSQQLRFAILRCFSWVPDAVMVRLQYRMKMGFWPDLRHPKRYMEKLQLYKMKYRNPVMHQCVDKYEVRKYVESKGLGHILNELYGVYDKPEEIPFDDLPNQFVLKTTTGGGGQNVIVVKDKSLCDVDGIRNKLASWVGANTIGALGGREWAFKGCKNRIIVEKYLEGEKCYSQVTKNEINDLKDYKFCCFNGEPHHLIVISDRKPGECAYIGIYDLDFNKLPVYICGEERAEQVVPKPKNYELMIEIARKLSADFPHVRVDLYNVNGKIYFGELTFYHGSGYFGYDPDDFDFEVGRSFTEY